MLFPLANSDCWKALDYKKEREGHSTKKQRNDQSRLAMVPIEWIVFHEESTAESHGRGKGEFVASYG